MYFVLLLIVFVVVPSIVFINTGPIGRTLAVTWFSIGVVGVIVVFGISPTHWDWPTALHIDLE
jgi:hypothetical protein